MNNNNVTYELKTIDQLEGIGRNDPQPARWIEYNWEEARGLKGDKKLWRHINEKGPVSLFRIDKGKTLNGWWALDDLIKVVCGSSITLISGHWLIAPHEGFQRAKLALRLIGADDRFEICENPANFPEGHDPHQVRGLDYMCRGK